MVSACLGSVVVEPAIADWRQERVIRQNETEPGNIMATKFTTTTTFSLTCPKCDSNHIIKVGKLRGVQRYQCRKCDKKFHASPNTPGRRFPPEQVGAAVRDFYTGKSYKQIAEGMADQYDIPEPSKRAIYSWVKDFTKKALREMENHKANVGDEWVVDKMQVKVGGEKYWNWNVMDKKTRYVLASHLSKSRGAREARAVLRKAAANAASGPKEVRTDRLKSYISAVDDIFGADAKHIQTDGIRAEVNNNLSERLQGTFRSREKTLRGLDSRESGQLYLDGWVLTYNLFREHEGVGGRTPGEAAKVTAPFKDWGEVVEVTSPKRVVPKVVEDSGPKSLKIRPKGGDSKKVPATSSG